LLAIERRGFRFSQPVCDDQYRPQVDGERVQAEGDFGSFPGSNGDARGIGSEAEPGGAQAIGSRRHVVDPEGAVLPRTRCERCAEQLYRCPGYRSAGGVSHASRHGEPRV